MTNWNAFFPPVFVTIKVSLVAGFIVFALALLTAHRMARSRMRVRSVIDTILLLPLVLPPTVVGFLLLVLFGRQGRIGQTFEMLFDRTIVFTWGAAVIAAVVVAFPLAYRTMRAGFEGVEKELEDAARAQGASGWQVFRYITMPLAGRSLTAGFLLGYARGLGEFGATLMIAGNIPGRTQTLPTAIYTAVDAGRMPLAWAWTGVIVLLSFAMLLAAERFNGGSRH
ncbi:MAG TPA: molybdate ABC transporter permease subunit [Paenibacillus sp.]|uniref:molybdate ABC transporter permease subunit n=1 Tax=Paenibacillus sp. TaxID=58172 RepID=UPI002BE51520|nr:molybdate ABC transporter permease subunit [Paenibacillus sp.]HUC90448.1 molybdate ABC transporter permease subunit [Paenibacillus sp.]